MGSLGSFAPRPGFRLILDGWSLPCPSFPLEGAASWLLSLPLSALSPLPVAGQGWTVERATGEIFGPALRSTPPVSNWVWVATWGLKAMRSQEETGENLRGPEKTRDSDHSLVLLPFDPSTPWFRRAGRKWADPEAWSDEAMLYRGTCYLSSFCPCQVDIRAGQRGRADAHCQAGSQAGWD